MHQENTPPTTLHKLFENAFPVWRENFHRSFKFHVEVDPYVPTFGANLGYATVVVDKTFVVGLEGESGKRIRKNIQENGKLAMDHVNLGQNPILDRGQLTRLFLFYFM